MSKYRIGVLNGDDIGHEIVPVAERVLRAAIARHLELSALRHASAIILPNASSISGFGSSLPKARVSIIPDPHAEISPDAFTFAEFSLAIEHIYDYVLRPIPEK